MLVRLLVLIAIALSIMAAMADEEVLWLNAIGVSGESDCVSKGGQWFGISPEYGPRCLIANPAACEAAGGFAYNWRRDPQYPFCDFNLGKLQEQCLLEGGKWNLTGIFGNPACIRQAKDAGKACQDSTDCEFKRCVYRGATLPPNSPATGVCVETNNMFGCSTPIRNGRVLGRICVD